MEIVKECAIEEILKILEKKIICVIFHFKNLEGHNQHKCLTENTENKIEQ